MPISNGAALDEGELRATVERLREHAVEVIAATYVDNAGIARTKAFPLERLGQALARGIGMSPVFDAFLHNDAITRSPHSGGPMGDLRLFPDVDSLEPIGGMPGWGFAAVERYDQTGAPHPHCSRGVASRLAARLEQRGVKARFGFEVEWAVSEGLEQEFVPATTAPAYGLGRIIELAEYARTVVANLAQSGIVVEQLHPEYAPGQFEVSLPPDAPVAAADKVVLARSVIRATGEEFGLRTSFAPVVEVDGVGNGGHVHLSATRDGAPLLAGGEGPGGLTADGASVVATILDWLPALLAIGAPSPASYLRLVPRHWAGAFRCWGVENREAAVRLVAATPLVGASAANLEVKCFDQAANPYLVVAGLLAALADGLDQGREPPPPLAVDPAEVEGSEPLPDSLAETARALEHHEGLRAALGEELVTSFLAVRRAELAYFAQASPAELVAATRWVY